MIKLIGIHGKKRAGKDTAGKLIQSITGYERIDSFADPLRKFGFMTFGITEENREEMIESIGKTGRQVLQLVGTEIGRVISPNFWIESLKYRNSNSDGGLIITDVRFDNEAEFIRNMGGRILEIQRPSLSGKADTHASEIPISRDLVDMIVINDSTIEEYERRIRVWFNQPTK